jgi:inner membrane protein YidH
MTERHTISPSDYLAAERTYLAWIRTGLALMGFGFVVARFGLFLQALEIGQTHLALQSAGLSPWLGTALIALGVIVNVGCTWRYLRLLRQFQRGETQFARPSFLAIAVAAILAALGLAMAVYLISVREPAAAPPSIIRRNQ